MNYNEGIFTKIFFMFKVIIFLLGFILANFSIVAQDSTKLIENKTIKRWDKVKNMISVTGYVQAEWNYTNKPDSVDLNTMTRFYERFDNNSFTIRRGRLGLVFEHDITKAMFGFDLTERSMQVTDLFFQITEPWSRTVSAKMGIYQIPFGFETQQPSFKRIFPERSRVVQHLFPTTRDLGASIIIEVPEGKKLHGLKISGSVFNGESRFSETNKYKDFSAAVRYNKKFKNDDIEIGLGASYYNGAVAHFSDYGTNPFNPIEFFVYRIGQNDTGRVAYLRDSVTSVAAGQSGIKITRAYYGADAQINFKWAGGRTHIGTEFIAGQQPGIVPRILDPIGLYRATSYSPTGPQFGVSWVFYANPTPANPTSVQRIRQPYHTLVRKFRGGYVQFAHEIMNTGLTVMFKYDWYDPNVQVKGSDIDIIPDFSKQQLGLSVADIKYQTYGFGLNYRINDFMSVTAYYDLVRNEATNIRGRAFDSGFDDVIFPSPGFLSDVKDDVFTLRMQFQF
jgi:hypothetical protein